MSSGPDSARVRGPAGELPRSDYESFLQAVDSGSFVYSSAAFLKEHQSKCKVFRRPCSLCLSHTPAKSVLKIYIDKAQEPDVVIDVRTSSVSPLSEVPSSKGGIEFNFRISSTIIGAVTELVFDSEEKSRIWTYVFELTPAGRLSRLTAELDVCKSDKASLSSRCEPHNREIEDLKGRLQSSGVQSIAERDRSRAELAREQARFTTERQKLTAKLEACTKDKSALSSRCETQTVEIEALKKQVQSSARASATEIDGLRAEFAREQAQFATERKQLSADLEACGKEKAVLSARCENLSGEVDSLKQQLHESASALAAEIERARVELAQQEERFAAERQQLAAELEACRQERAALSMRCEDLSEEVKRSNFQLQSSALEWNAEIDRLRDELAQEQERSAFMYRDLTVELFVQWIEVDAVTAHCEAATCLSQQRLRLLVADGASLISALAPAPSSSDPEVASVDSTQALNNISAAARLAVDKGDFINAEVLYAQSVRMCRESTVGTAEEGVIRREFANLLVRLDKLPRAEQEMKACVAIFVDTYGEVHPLTGEVLAELAALQFQISDPDALVTSQRTVECLRAALGGAHANTAQALFNLGNVAANQENHVLAIESYSSALDSFRVNNQHEEAGQAAQALAVNHKKRSEFGLAAKYYSEASEEYSASFGPTDKRSVDAAKRAAAALEAERKAREPAAAAGPSPGKGRGRGKK